LLINSVINFATLKHVWHGTEQNDWCRTRRWLGLVAGKWRRRDLANFVNHIIGIGNNIEISIRALFYVWWDAEAGANLQGLAFVSMKFVRSKHVIGYAVCQTRIRTDINMHPIWR